MVQVRTVTNFYPISLEPVSGESRRHRARRYTDSDVESLFDAVVNETLEELQNTNGVEGIEDVVIQQSLSGDLLVLTALIKFNVDEEAYTGVSEEEIIESDEPPALADGRNKITIEVFTWIKGKFQDGELSVSEIVDAYNGELSADTVRKIVKTTKFEQYYRN